MSLNLNTNSVTNYSVGQDSTTNAVRNNKCYTNFKASNNDSFERSNTNPKHKTSKMNIALGTILSVGLLIGADFAFNHGKASRSLWNKIHPTEQVSKSYVDNIEQVQQHFSQIFGKDFSKDEANELAKTYIEIMRIDTSTQEGSKNYISKLYKQVMKDFGFDKAKLETELAHCDEPIYAEISGANHSLKIYCLDQYGRINTDISKAHYMEALCHELTHARQHNLAFATNRKSFIEALLESAKRHEKWTTILRENNNDEVVTYNYFKSEFEKAINKGLCSDVTPITRTHPDYNKGLQYIENIRNYKSPREFPLSEYRAQLLEKEAFRVGDLTQELLSLLGVK